MWTITAAVRNDLLSLAAGVHQRVGEDRHALERLVVIDRLCEADYVGGAPTWVEGDRAEGIAENLAQERTLTATLLPLRILKCNTAEAVSSPIGDFGI